MSTVEAEVLDAKTKEPLPYASVYLTERKDSVITNFTLTDTLGKAAIKDVPMGAWMFHVEMMGYKSYVKEVNVNKNRKVLGKIMMQVDEKFLKAALISDVGNPIVIKRDTIEYHADSFRFGDNEMLKDLLRRMPGIDITDDGKVKAYGEEISRITVNGKTFFFNDQAMTLENLPASIVDKVRVIERESEAKRTTGIEDGVRIKEMDVALKKEYADGWFGNLAAKGGTTVGGKEKEELRDDRGLLFSGKALASYYNDKEQYTFIASGNNIGEGSVYRLSAGESTSGNGLTTSATVGANAASTRVKDVEIAASASYGYNNTETGQKTLQTNYRTTGDLSTESMNSGNNWGRRASANFSVTDLKPGKFNYTLNAAFNLNDAHSNSASGSKTLRDDGAFMNSSSCTSQSDNITKGINIYSVVGYSGLGGDPMRSVSLSVNMSHSNSGGTSNQYSITRRGSLDEVLDLSYNNAQKYSNINSRLQYGSGLLGKHFRLQLYSQVTANLSDNSNDAFNPDGSSNSYYTSLSESRYIDQLHGVSIAYNSVQREKHFGATIGAGMSGTKNRLFSRSYGVESLTGDEWIWGIRPMVQISYTKGSTRLFANLSAQTRQPSRTSMVPTLNVSNPLQIGLGNIYLKPSIAFNPNVSLRGGNAQRFTSYNINLRGSVVTNQTVMASWFDGDGVNYSFPVNSRHPSINTTLDASYNTPVNKDRTIYLSLDLFAGYNNRQNYYATGSQPIPSRENFEYSPFMEEFWGDESGSIFYGGGSGFIENNANTYQARETAHLKYSKGAFALTFGLTNAWHYSHYTLPGTEDKFTTENRIGMASWYKTPHQWGVGCELNYNFFTGYAEGYNRPELHWDMTLEKSFGPVTLTVTAHDILDQTRNLYHIDGPDYMTESYRLILGRYMMAGIKWNFGKMNAAQNSRAQRASYDIEMY